MIIYRPTDTAGNHVNPAELDQYCVAHNIPGPCCFCPLKDAANSTFVEAPFLLANSGIHSGEYIAKCAEGSCGYFGVYGFVPFRPQLNPVT